MKWYEAKENLPIADRIALLTIFLLEICQVVSVFVMFYSFTDGLLMFGCSFFAHILLRISFEKQTGLKM